MTNNKLPSRGIDRGKPAHVALKILKVMNSPTHAKTLTKVSPKLLDPRTRKRTLGVLLRHGFIVEIEESVYMITSRGIDMVNEVPVRHPKQVGAND